MEGSRGKEAGTTIGSNEDRSSRRKKSCYPGIFTALFLLLKKGNCFFFVSRCLVFFWGSDPLGSSYPRDRLF